MSRLPDLVISAPVLQSLRAYSKLPYEVTGYIVFRDTGKIDRIMIDYDDMTLDRDPAGYDIVFHSHPQDYTNLFPDHPSVTDIETTHFLVCTVKETQAHIVATPKFLYVITPLCTTVLPSSNTGRLFDGCAREHPDRNTEEFRQCYLAQLLHHNIAKVTRIPWDQLPPQLSIQARFTPVPPWLKYVPLAVGSLLIAVGLYALVQKKR